MLQNSKKDALTSRESPGVLEHARCESVIWPTTCPAPGTTKDDDQYRYQDHQQIVKIELKRRLKPLELNELINQSHALFISKFLGNEARYERYEVGNRAQQIEKHLAPLRIEQSIN